MTDAITKTKTWREVLKIHPAAELLPLATPEELRGLSEDIKWNGLQHPVVFWYRGKAQKGRVFNKDAVLLDGRNRLDALGLDTTGHQLFDAAGNPNFPFECVYELDATGFRIAAFNCVPDPDAYVISANIHRRHLTAAQKGELIAALLKARPERSGRATARVAKVSDKTVGVVRNKLEARAEIPHVERRDDINGRSQPAHKPPASNVVSLPAAQPPPAERAITLSQSIADAAPLKVDLSTTRPDPKVASPNKPNQVLELIYGVGELTTEQRRSFWNLCAQRWPEPMRAALVREQKADGIPSGDEGKDVATYDWLRGR
jgi:hypothetical protein